MLRTMRDNLKSLSITLWLVIAAFIVSIFVVYGMQSAGPGAISATGAAATVNGERISCQEFQRAYRQQVATLQRIYGDQWKEELIRDLGIRRQVLDGLITSRLLLQEAERYGLTVSREELADAVMHNPLFAEEGTFSRERYRGLLEANRLTPERYEESVRETLLHQKLATLIQASAKVSETEAWEAFRAAREKVRVAYISLPRSEENRARLEKLHARASQKGTSVEKLLQNSGLKPKRPKPFAFGEAVVDLDPSDSRAFHLAILRLKEEDISPVIEGRKSLFLIHLLDREAATREAFENEKATWMQQLLAKKRRWIWASWIQDLKGRAQIEIASEVT
ncbi:MAG: SurA N-terminal domain-containing protein [Candidatus Methylomirabilales bacterium]